MTDKTQDKEKKTLSLSKGKLELNKAVGSGQVRQSFSQGRSKSVEVEVKRTRTISRPAQDSDKQSSQEPAAAAQVTLKKPEGLTQREWEFRLKAVAVEAERAKIAAEEKKIRDAKEAEALAIAKEEERLAEEARKEEEKNAPVVEQESESESAPVTAVETKQEAGKDSAKVTEVKEDIEEKSEKKTFAATPKPGSVHTHGKKHKDDDDEDDSPAKGAKSEVRKEVVSARKSEDKRRGGGKITLQQALMESEGHERHKFRSEASLRRAREKEKMRLAQQNESIKIVREVIIPETISVGELANRMAVRGADVVKTLMQLGTMATINQMIDADTAELVVSEFGHTPKRVSAADVEQGLKNVPDAQEDLLPRAPVVTIMGHVDHGKTSLLDALRRTDVALHEAGGITQHIGAYQVTLASGDKISFIDTPGHAAFTEMRARGAHVTDIVVLVVAADDGIKEQTVEAISHIKAAKVPMIVAINKIDKPGANPERVRTELLQHEIVLEELGGDTMSVEVSAKQGTNLDKLEEAILLQAEMLELKANPNASASGTVIESRMEQGRGAIATVLIQRGTLRVGDIFVTGSHPGKVRALLDDWNSKLKEAGPSMPVEVFGLNGSPQAGDDFIVVESDARAREIAEYRQDLEKSKANLVKRPASMEDFFAQSVQSEIKELPIVIKGDVQGSVEAIIGSISKLATDEVKVRVLHSGVGAITESDVILAKASGGVIIGFNVRANPQARELAKRDQVSIRYYSIIYEAIDDMKAAMGGLLSPTVRETYIGRAEIRQVFNVTKVGKISGCMVTEGMIKRGSKVRLLRDDVVIHEGTLKSLRRFKDEVKEVREGYECGCAFENYSDIKEGDVIECFEVTEEARTL